MNEQTRIGLAKLMERCAVVTPDATWRIEWKAEGDPWVTVELLLGSRSSGRWAIWRQTGDVYDYPRTADDLPEPVSDDPIILVAP